MLQGVVPFPAEYAAMCRSKGYWRDQSLAQEFAAVFAKYANRVAIIDRGQSYTYRQIDEVSERLALNLLSLGLKPLDPVVLQLPNVVEFVFLYFALQKIGAIPIAALSTHRHTEVSQFVSISRATTCVYPESQGDFAFGPMVKRIADESASLKERVARTAPTNSASIEWVFLAAMSHASRISPRGVSMTPQAPN